MDLEEIKVKVGDVSSLTASQVFGLEKSIRTEFDAADARDDIDTMDQLVSLLAAVESYKEDSSEPLEASASETVVDDADTDIDDDVTEEEIQAELARMSELTEEVAEEATDEVTDEVTEVADEATEEVAEEAHTETVSTKVEENSAMAASFSPPEDSRPLIEELPVAVVAGGDIPGTSAGSQFKSLDDVNAAFVSRINSLKRVNGGDGEQVLVASVQATYPEIGRASCRERV